MERIARHSLPARTVLWLATCVFCQANFGAFLLLLGRPLGRGGLRTALFGLRDAFCRRHAVLLYHDFRCRRAFSAIRALTNFRTRVAGKGLPG